MYTITFSVYGTPATDVYHVLQEAYRLPSLALLVASLKQDVTWQDCDESLQVYALDNLREPQQRNTFQLRFKTQTTTRQLNALFVSLTPENTAVHALFLQFPTKGNRGCATKIIAALKSYLHLHPDAELNFETTGYAERADLRYISERSISSFYWNERLQRYLHGADHFNEIKEVRAGIL